MLAMGTVEDIEGLPQELGCSTRIPPTTYLGLPLGMQRNSNFAWEGVKERFRKKPATWKRQHISKGGRLTLIKSTLFNLSIYIMSLFRLPKGVKTRLEKIQRDLLWDGGSLKKKIHLVSQDIVCYAKEKGGLGIRGLFIVSRALLGKWVWRFEEEVNLIWKDVVRLRYQVKEGGWFTKKPKGKWRSGLWKDISKENKQLKRNRFYVLGDRNRICFQEN